jgi:hypothetical protein
MIGDSRGKVGGPAAAAVRPVAEAKRRESATDGAGLDPRWVVVSNGGEMKVRVGKVEDCE